MGTENMYEYIYRTDNIVYDISNAKKVGNEST